MSQHRAPKRRADKHQRATRATSSQSSQSFQPSPSSGRHRAGGSPEPTTPAQAAPAQASAPAPESVAARTAVEAPAPKHGRATRRDRRPEPEQRPKPTPTPRQSAVPKERRGFTRPPALLVAGTSALLVAAAGAMNVGAAQAARPDRPEAVAAMNATMNTGGTDAARAAEPQDSLGSQLGRDGRPATISRSSRRAAIDEARQQQLEQQAEAQAAARRQALTQLAGLAEDRAKQIKQNLWVLPVDHYQITATFGDGGGLWSSDHTGLDFAAPIGTPAMAVHRGVVTETGYAGAYGNRVIITHADGSETWYCHLNDYSVSTGQSVVGGQMIGHVGMTGNTTGPHLHLEVRPTPDVPIDPYNALIAHGLNP